MILSVYKQKLAFFLIKMLVNNSLEKTLTSLFSLKFAHIYAYNLHQFFDIDTI